MARLSVQVKMLPVVTRELGAIARRRSAYWMRAGAAAAAFLALAYMCLLAMANVPMLELGQRLLDTLAYGGFVYALLAGVRGTSDALSEEKREGTLGLLFLTDLKGYDVVFGKFVSLSINSFYGLLAIVPALSLAFLLGGATPQQFVMICAALLNTLFYSLAVGLCVSTFSQNERPAMGITLAIVFLTAIAGLLFCFFYVDNNFDVWNYLLPGFLLTSPVYALYIALDGMLAQSLNDVFWLSCGFTHLSAWLCLVLASGGIASRAHLEAPKSRIAAFFLNIRQRWSFGRAQHRVAIRRRFLDRNAFYWLAGRDRLKRRYAWIFIVLLGAVWIFARITSPEIMADWPVTVVSIWFLHLFFKLWMASEVAARFIEDRRTNATELLLTTPFSLSDFAKGQFLALLRQFGGPIAVALAVNFAGAWFTAGSYGYGFESRESTPFFVVGVIHLLADAIAIPWIAMWRSFHLRGTNRTILQTIGIVVLIPMFGLFLMWQGAWILSITLGWTAPPLIVLLQRWTVLCLIYDAIMTIRARRAFYRDFREAATRSFDKPTPSRFFSRRKTAAPKVKSPSKNHFTPRLAAILALSCLTLVISARLRSQHLEKIVKQRLAASRAKGLPTNPADLSQWRPSQAPAQSGMATLHTAFGVFQRPPRAGMFSSAYTSSRHVAREIPEDLRAAAIDFVNRNKDTFEILKQLPNKMPDFPTLDVRGPFQFGTEDILPALQFKGLLELEAHSHEAAATISTLLHYARVCEGPGAIGSGRHALQIAGALMEKAALQGGFPKEDWEQWQSILQQINFPDKLHAWLVWERVQALEYMHETPDKLYQDFGRQMINFPALFNATLAIRTFVGQDFAEELYLLDEYDHGLASAGKVYSEVVSERAFRPTRAPSLASPYLIAPMLVPAFDAMFHFCTTTVAHQNVMLAAIEIELYRAEHRNLPDDARALGKPLPVDPFRGAPLRYQKIDTGYAIDVAPQEKDPDIGNGRRLVRFEGASFICGPREEKPLRGVRK